MWALCLKKRQGLFSALSFYSTAPKANMTVGQPTAWTHPELMKQNEVTPGITFQEYEFRRKRLCDVLQPGSLVILSATAQKYMSGVIPYPYRQDPDFMYLTGLLQPGIAILEPRAAGDHKFTLFINPNEEEKVRWTGKGVDKAAALEFFGASDVYFMEELRSRLFLKLGSATAIYCDLDRPSNLNYDTWIAMLNDFKPLVPVRHIMHMMRSEKSPAEIALMRQSANMTAQSLVSMMRATRVGVTERQLQAIQEYEVRRQGSFQPAFPPVIAGGSAASIVHYGDNTKMLRDGEMVLADVGCEYWGYISDVARTWPVNGTYTSAQRDLYSAVLEVQKSCIAATKPGATIRGIHQLSIDLLSAAMKDLGIIKDASVEEIKKGPYRPFYCHQIGHNLGMDTHDVASLGYDKYLRPGSVITIEPGLYIPDEEEHGHFRGMGIRIEDDVLVTEDGYEVLSHAAPTEIKDVEEIVGTLQAGPLGLPL